jgi:endoglucanase
VAFGPNDPVTREQAMVILCRYAGGTGDTNVQNFWNFQDAWQAHYSWAYDGISWCISAGVVSGRTGASGQALLAPLDTVTRAEAAKMVRKVAAYLGNSSASDAAIDAWAAAHTPAAQGAEGVTGTTGGASDTFGNENGQGNAAGTGTTAPAGTALAQHGALSVAGSQLVDESGSPVQLCGMSTHGIAWFGQYVNADAFQTMRDTWGINCVRLAMYTSEYNGYCTGGNKSELRALVCSGVDAATSLGMYAIVDWHVLNDQNPLTYVDEAKQFFAQISAQYASNKNVIYEICNEPNSSATWADITAYANQVIPVIRANNPSAVIIVGTPTWSQDIEAALYTPLAFDNVMYALHFYAGTHTQWLRTRVAQCAQAGLPIFISEFGTCDASGTGANNFTEANAWVDLINQYKLSYVMWNLSNKNETSAVLLPSCTKTSGWTDADLTEAGKWFKHLNK